MLTTLKNLVKDKNILILGFGREGKSTYKLLLKTDTYKSLTIADLAAVEYDLPENIKVVSGEAYQDTLDDYDIVFKSPGIVLKKNEKEYKCRIMSQTELFFEKFSKQTIGITGTKGKSTTASLLYHVLKECEIPCVIVGNIGVPAFDMAEYISEDTVVVFELSSHQLEYTKLSPHIGVLLNIYEEHLDHYGTFEKYALAKKNIYKYQNAGDILFCNVNNLPADGECSGKIITASGEKDNTDLYIEYNDVVYFNRPFAVPVNEIKLMGRHNLFNIGIVYALCKYFDISDSRINEALKTYQPLPHRLEFIGVTDGVKYYDDSISTICETTIQALKTLTDVNSVLIGGMDRGIDYFPLIDFLNEFDVGHIILMSDTGKRIYSDMKDKYPQLLSSKKVFIVDTLEEAVRLAKKVTVKGKSCLLSPAAASYGIFKNFEERGEVFKDLVAYL